MCKVSSRDLSLFASSQQACTLLCHTGSDVGSMGNLDQDSCGELFRENPEMKKVHSLASAAALLKRVAATQPKQSCI